MVALENILYELLKLQLMVQTQNLTATPEACLIISVAALGFK